MYIKKSKGPKMEPCGAPAVKLFSVFYLTGNIEGVTADFQKHRIFYAYRLAARARPYQMLWRCRERQNEHLELDCSHSFMNRMRYG